MSHPEQKDDKLKESGKVELPFLDTHGLQGCRQGANQDSARLYMIPSFYFANIGEMTCLPLVQHTIESNQARQLEKTSHFERTQGIHVPWKAHKSLSARFQNECMSFLLSCEVHTAIGSAGSVHGKAHEALQWNRRNQVNTKPATDVTLRYHPVIILRCEHHLYK